MSSLTFTQLREKTQKMAMTMKVRKKNVFLSTITAATFCINEPPLFLSIAQTPCKARKAASSNILYSNIRDAPRQRAHLVKPILARAD